MSSRADRSELDKIVGEILVAFLNHNSVAASDLPTLVRELRAAFDEESIQDSPIDRTAPGAPLLRAEDLAEPVKHGPAVPIEDSVHDEYLVSLEDGKRFRSLRRHLMAKYGMTPEDYRRKWQLPEDYPMVAPSYAKERSEVAKRIGLGRADNKSGKERSQGHR